ncbi:uncharacterized protein C9orf50 homolog isoform X1 [Erinaceus europaeus]|uniref:Uncharacterized protein C9orf50 homolog isoform X1 n=2 Tax=Erinaceus europaeus TaxID=9365 RepID=A0ABM3Y5F6_ERIEU|nr:uncharacterized protein C9orf50 homolog isoform X1 [Erinaceus europaeus]
MTRRRPKSRDQQGAHKGSLDEADCRRRAPLLSRLIQSELRAVPGATASPAAQHQRGLSGYCQSSQCPSCSFLPEQRGQSSHFQKGLEKILLHQIPTLGPQRSDQLQFKRNNHLGTQTPKGQALQTHRSSGEGAEARPRRRYCPFRVRFADETLRDTALRYWERSCAAQQCIAENENATRSAAPGRVLGALGALGRWLENLPTALYPQPMEEATASPTFSWDCPGPPFRELQDILSENTSMNSNLTCTPRAASQSQRGGLKAFLETNGILDQAGKPPTWGRKLESFLPRLVLNSVLKRGRPKGYQLLLPPTTWQQAQR